MSAARVRDVVDAVGARFPWEWAEPWDRVGLAVGDPDGPVERVLVALDPTSAAVREAVRLRAQVLLTHHPAFLEPPARWLADAPGSRVAFAAAKAGIALVAAHTNLDRAPEGAAALPNAIGVPVGESLEAAMAPADVLVTYVPRESVDGVLAALDASGAGCIGRYKGCSFSGPGTGRYRAGEDATPAIGGAGASSVVEEVRVEALCAPGAGSATACAVRAAHPYEEPVIIVTAGGVSRGLARAGRVGRLGVPMSLADLAAMAGAALGVSPRVYGEPDRRVVVVATMGGSGRSVVGEAVSAGADVLVTGELRYHDALAASDGGLAIVECGHDATELPLLAPLAAAAALTKGLGPEAVMLHSPRPVWWSPKEP